MVRSLLYTLLLHYLLLLLHWRCALRTARVAIVQCRRWPEASVTRAGWCVGDTRTLGERGGILYYVSSLRPRAIPPAVARRHVAGGERNRLKRGEPSSRQAGEGGSSSGKRAPCDDDHACMLASPGRPAHRR